MIGRRRRRGTALAFALLTLAVVAVAVSAVHAAQLRMLDGTRLERDRTAAFWAAEAGVVRARSALAADVAYDGETRELGNARVQIRVDPDARDLASFTVTCVGEAGSGGGRAPDARVRITARLATGADGRLAVVDWESSDPR